MQLDVASGGELHVALAAGVPAERLVLHGNNKSDDELERGLVLPASAASWSTASTSSTGSTRCTRADGAVPKVLLRITPGIEAHTHEYVMTGQDDSKFGFGLASGDAARGRRRGPRRPRRSSWSASTPTSAPRCSWPTSSSRPSRALAPFVNPLGLPELSIGGGLGVAYVEGEAAPTITEWGEVVRRRVRRGRHHRPGVRRARPGDRRGRGDHALPGRHRQAAARHPHLRGGATAGSSTTPGRRSTAAATRRSCPGRVAADRPRHDPARRQALRVGRRARARRPCARRPRRRRRAGHAGHRRLRPLDGLQLQQAAPPGRRVRAATGTARLVVRRETDEDLLRTDVG